MELCKKPSVYVVGFWLKKRLCSNWSRAVVPDVPYPNGFTTFKPRELWAVFPTAEHARHDQRIANMRQISNIRTCDPPSGVSVEDMSSCMQSGSQLCRPSGRPRASLLLRGVCLRFTSLAQLTRAHRRQAIDDRLLGLSLVLQILHGSEDQDCHPGISLVASRHLSTIEDILPIGVGGDLMPTCTHVFCLPAFPSCGDNATEEGTATKLDLHVQMHMPQQRGTTASYHGYIIG